MKALAQALSPRLHYAWIVAVLTFVILLMAVAVRATPSVLIVPLEDALGWSRGVISFAISINIILYGLMGPFAAALMQQIGIRRTVLLALTLIAGSVALSSQMTQTWQLVLTWGLGVGLGSGVTALVLGATIVNRWFSKHQGLVMGFITASTATGNLVFLPFLASIAQHHGWQPVVWITAAAVAAMIPIVRSCCRRRRQRWGFTPMARRSTASAPPTARANPITVAFNVLGTASKSGGFWLLFASFFVCGASTNGLIGTHLISYCIDHGLPEVTGASLLAAMGVFDLFGTTISGWLSDRYDSRWLLFWYYGLRGLSLIYLPYSGFSLYGLSFFAVFYGLDWIATVPPTLRLTRELFGKENAPIVFGWLLAGHQLGAGAIAFEAGAVRSVLGDYYIPVLLSGGLCIIAALLVLRIGRGTARGGLATATT